MDTRLTVGQEVHLNGGIGIVKSVKMFETPSMRRPRYQRAFVEWTTPQTTEPNTIETEAASRYFIA